MVPIYSLRTSGISLGKTAPGWEPGCWTERDPRITQPYQTYMHDKIACNKEAALCVEVNIWLQIATDV